MSRCAAALAVVSALLSASLVACGGSPGTSPAQKATPVAAPAVAATPTSPHAAAPATAATFKPPADHLKNRKGAMHKKGSSQALVNCSECHGADLRGGKAPSCYSCHDRKWK